ncbi:MAG: hypothetical protein ACRYFU_23910 [Janthinobacterium lividum]
MKEEFSSFCETLEVNGREPFNTASKLAAPNSYFADDSGWKVTIRSDSGLGPAPWPLISNDGETMILVNTIPPISNRPLLAIYRRNESGGKLLREYKVEELWTLKRGEEPFDGFSSGTPFWFAKGRFSFSPDQKSLLFVDETHGLLRLSLTDGTLSKS